MAKVKGLKALAVTFFVSGVYDAFGGFYYAFMVGVGRSVSSPPTHTFYALFIASFLLCFSYLQILSAFNIHRYLLNVGVFIIGRIFYFVILNAYMLFVADFPNTFWATGLIDLLWCFVYVLLTVRSDEIRVRNLFFPYRETS